MTITNTTHLAHVVGLAREVASLAAQVREQQDAHDKAFRKWDHATGWFQGPCRPSPALTGELRRRSMDLTRALAQLRKP